MSPSFKEDQVDERSSGEELRVTRRGELIADTYRLTERIGSGGMGEVYAAEHVRLGRRFAIKLLRPGSEAKAAARFRKESQAIALIENEYVVSVIDCGEAKDRAPYLVMELLRGEDLRSLLERASPLPIFRAVNLLCDACRGVAAVHEAGLVHRDLKPGNLFVTRRATGEDWCKVLDFGVAKLTASNSTVEGTLIGTVHYMAPEQLEDGASAGASADVYALGAILYEALSGVTVHSAASMQELMFKIMNDTPVRLDERRPEVPRRLADAVHRALSRRPERRFASVQELASAIAPFARPGQRTPDTASAESVGDETVASQRGGPHASVKRRRWRLVAAVAALCGAASLAALGVRANGSQSATAAVAATATVAPRPAAPPAAEPPAPVATATVPKVERPEPTLSIARAPSAQPISRRRPSTPPATAGHSPPKPQFDFANPYSQ